MTGNLERIGFDFFDDFDVRKSILEISEQFGGIYDSPHLKQVQSLVPKDISDDTPNTYSGLFGRGEFPYHSDMAHWYKPPRFILLRCKTPNENVSTTLVSAKLVLPDYRSSIASRSLFKPRKRLDSKAYFLKVSEPHLWRWDSIFIQPANNSANELKTRIEKSLSSVSSTEIRFTREGQVLIIDNWSMLHGRSAVPDSSTGREIERVYLKGTLL